MQRTDTKIEQMMGVVDHIISIAKNGNLRVTTPELSILIFLKFTSDNADKLGVKIDRFHSYNALTSLLVSKAITIDEFLGGCAEIIVQTGMDGYGIISYLTQFIVPLAHNQAMHRILALVAEMDLTDDPERCMAASLMEAVISKFRITAHDEYNTSSDSVATLMAKIVISNDCTSVYDGVCGYGLGLMKAHTMAPQAQIEGQDININCVMVSAIMQWLAFNLHFEIASGDTFRNPLPMKTMSKYDAVMMAPPFGLRIDDDVIMNASEDMVKYSDMTPKRSEWFFVQHAAAILSEVGNGILHLPMGVLFQGGKVQNIRKTFLENGHIRAVIALPEGMVPSSVIPSVLLVIGEKSDDTNVFFVNGTAPKIADFFSRGKRNATAILPDGIQKLAEIVLERKQIDGVSALVSLEQIRAEKYLLTPSVYTDKNSDQETNVESVDKIFEMISVLENELIFNGKELENAVQKFKLFF